MTTSKGNKVWTSTSGFNWNDPVLKRMLEKYCRFPGGAWHAASTLAPSPKNGCPTAAPLPPKVTSTIFQTPSKLAQWFHQRSPLHYGAALLSLTVLLGSTSAVWFITQLTSPLVAQTNPSRMTVSLNLVPGESYSTLISRAEATARALAQRHFDINSAATNVAIMIVGEREGAIAPLLSMEVSREQWRSQPEPQRWTTYFVTARALLGIDNPTHSQTAPTAATPTTAPAQPTAVPAQPTAVTDPSTTQTTPAATLPNPNPVQINLPAAPSGQLGLPRSILRP